MLNTIKKTHIEGSTNTAADFPSTLFDKPIEVATSSYVVAD